jgi:hypothetical protein
MAWYDFLTGGSNPADAAMPYLNQIPGQTQKFEQPFFEAGTNALPGLQEQYSSLLNNPGQRLNEIGQDFHESPGFQFALQQALQAGNQSAAAGGMAGSPQHVQNNIGLATNLGNQEYNNWIQNALGLYKGGLAGEQGLANQGQQAGQHISDTLAQTLAQQGNLAFQGQAQKNANQNALFGNAIKGAGMAFGAFNPFTMGGALGSSMYGGG